MHFTTTDHNMSANDKLLEVHRGLRAPGTGANVPGNRGNLVRGAYTYYHYLCDGFDDRGWGCGYRTLQTLCSWINSNTNTKTTDVPTLRQIQDILVQLEDKPKSFAGSREWIGSFEACLVIDHLYNIPCKMLHVDQGSKLESIAETLKEHFTKFCSPAMMGGDRDCSSKGVLGIHIDDEDIHILVLDPHFVGKNANAELLQNKSWVKWQHLDNFIKNSFYNLCLPQIEPRLC